MVDQASEAFYGAKIEHGLIVAGAREDISHRVHIGSVLTVGRRLDRLPPPDIVCWDESHHIPSKTWMKIFKAYDKAWHLGLTATPWRLSGEGLGECFEEMVCGPTVRELIEMRFLSKYRYFTRPLDVSGMKVTGGDFNKKAMAEKMQGSTITGNLIEEYREFADGKQMLVFCPTVEFSVKFAEQMTAAGIPAAHLDGETHALERGMILEKFRAKELRVV